MATYSINNEFNLHNVIRQLRGEGYRAWSEIHRGREVLCTSAPTSIIGLCAGDGLWATKLFAGIPCETCIIS